MKRERPEKFSRAREHGSDATSLRRHDTPTGASVISAEPAVWRPSNPDRGIARQGAVADYGYGQIKATGIIDGDTRAAIEQFERERKLPITGQASDRVVRELAAMTGRPLE